MDLKWIVLDNADDENEKLNNFALELNVPLIIAQILWRREVKTIENAHRFFRATTDQLYDPFLLKDMPAAVERLRKAILSDEKILIYGDYDVDGITSVSFLYLLLKELGANVYYYIPDRQQEGYGLSEKGIRQAGELGINLIITVDCGITGHQEIALASSLNIDVIVSDHHEPGADLPSAVAVIDPKRSDCTYPFKELAGVGVSYKLAQGLLLRMEIDDSILEKYIELVAIGTAADIVPLIDENRIFVKSGLERLNDSDNIGLKTLIYAAGLYGKDIGTGQIVFIIAPRLNAVGRMGDAERAVKLLTTNDEQESQRIAEVIESENRHRKSVDEETFNEALMLADQQFRTGNTHSLVLHKKNWHTGVIGIVASRIVEKFYRPTALISVEDGVGKASARSIQGFDLYESLKDCEDLLLGYGGHKYAAGLSIDESNIESFRDRFEKIARQKLTEDLLIPKLSIDAEIQLTQINDKFVTLLKKFAPFGPHNMRPVFVSRKLQVVGTPMIVGKNHLKFKVRQDGCVLDVIGFNMGDLFYRLSPGESNLDLAYVIEENEFMGRKSIQLRAKDLR
ncbi:single-stranded-DNA-specific exonuclease RecJ [candidate division KSB1 bacterium]|nr:single-stranded-DNA-specific exonuclease RecJ [candidate division KSB1 bacterium]